MTRKEIARFFADPQHPLQRRFEAMRLFFQERRPALEVAQRLGYSLSAVYNMTRAFAKLDDPAAAYFRDPVPRGRPPARPASSLRQRIVALRKRNLSVPDIKARLDGEGEHSASERVVYRVLQEEGFQRLPRRSRAERRSAAAPVLRAPVSRALDPQHRESFQCESAAGVLCLLPWVRRYGIDTAIEQAGFPGSSQLAALPSVLAFVALKLASVRRYSSDDLWCMDRGLGLFAGLNVLPKAAWFSSYSDRVVGNMNRGLLTALGRVWKEHGLVSGAVNLDFTTIPHWGDDTTLQSHWSGHHGRSLVGLSVALAQDPDSGLLLRSDPRTRRETSSEAILEFLDFYRDNGPELRYLAFDSRFTTYANLSRLNRDKVRFITVRRRGKRIIEQARQIDPKDRRQIRVPLQRGTRLVRAHSSQVRLRGYDGKLRQITIFRGPSRRPALLLTNDLATPTRRILRRYARRWLVEKSISEQLSFFHLNRLSSSMVIKVDFDLAMTITAYNLYRLLALDLPAGHSHLTARTLFERMLCTGATVRLGRDTCLVTLKKKRNLPALLETLQAQEPVRVPWIGNRRIVYEGDTRS